MDLSVRSEVFAGDDQTWLGSARGTSSARSITLDTSAFTAGTHYPGGVFPSGLPLGQITTTGLYGPWDAASVDGRAVLAGFLLSPIKAGASTAVDVVGALLDHGRIIAANVPVTFDPVTVADATGQFIFV